MSLVIKRYDQGTESAFISRLFLGVLELRDLLEMGSSTPLNRPISREQFDKLYDPIFIAMKTILDTAREIMELVENYKKSITTGEIVTFQGSTFTITETIDGKLNQLVGILLDQGTIAGKDRLQALMNELYSLNIGFLYQPKGAFENGISILQKNREIALANYLKEVRKIWLEKFILLRNNRHEGWTLRGYQYRKINPNIMEIYPPIVGDASVEQFARLSVNRILLFVENIIAHGYQRSNRLPIFLVEIPKEVRGTFNNKRFRAVPKGMQIIEKPWEISFQDSFDFV